MQSATLSKDDSDRGVQSFASKPSLLILLNPGRVTRHCLLDMADAARNLNIPVYTYELGPLWSKMHSCRTTDPAAQAAWLRERNVAAVLGYTCNGLLAFPFLRDQTGRTMSLLEYLRIPHLMWWTDHPQWAGERIALRPELQPHLASSNQFHIVKSEFAARELNDILGWRNCIGMPVADNPNRYLPIAPRDPEYDIVCITGAPPALDADLEAILESGDPLLNDILQVVERKCVHALQTLMRQCAPKPLLSQLESLVADWCAGRARDPLATTYEVFTRLRQVHADAARWIRENPPVYFNALEILWGFGHWQRTFYIRYLARYFSVGVFGSDWSSVGLGSGGWVDYDDQGSVYAKGRIALNIPQAGDEQGVAHKPFQIAAAKVPIAHLFRRGLENCFTPGEEVLTFETPGEARERIGELLNDRDRRESMASAAYTRLLRDHTWRTRLPQILSVLGPQSKLAANLAECSGWRRR